MKYTNEDLDTMREMCARGCSVDEIAETLGRQRHLVMIKMRTMGLRNITEKGKKTWTEEELERVRKMVHACYPQSEIAKRFGVSVNSIRSIIVRMGLGSYYTRNCHCEKEEKYIQFDRRFFSRVTEAVEATRKCGDAVLKYSLNTSITYMSGEYRVQYVVHTKKDKDGVKMLERGVCDGNILLVMKGGKCVSIRAELLEYMERCQRYNGEVVVNINKMKEVVGDE